MIDTDKYRQMLREISPKYIRALFKVDECPVPLTGECIKRHLQGCEHLLVCAATLGGGFDGTLRRLQLTDMAGAVFLDSLAGEYLERFCDESDAEIIGQAQEQVQTARFSPGYGDFPLNVNRDIITVLNASIRIGLCTTDDYILTPQKSITGIVGVRKLR